MKLIFGLKIFLQKILQASLTPNTTKALKTRKLKFPKTNLILRTYFAHLVHPENKPYKNQLDKFHSCKKNEICYKYINPKGFRNTPISRWLNS